MRAITDVSDSSTLSSRGFWRVNASPVSISCELIEGIVHAPDDTVAVVQRTALESMSETVLAIAAEHEVEPMLRRLVRSARELAGARYAALGIPDGEGAFAQFITAGMSDELIAAMGPLPRTHGLLGAMLESPESLPHARHPAGPAVPRLVAARAPADALVPRRPDRVARERDRRLLPDRQGGRRRFRRPTTSG